MSFIFAPNEMLDSFILMHLTIEGPMHGYALAATFEEKFGWKPSLTTIYNILKKMESEDVVSVTEKIESGRVQKLYSITEKGKKLCDEKKQKMKQQMKQIFEQFFTIFQDVEKLEQSEETKKTKKMIRETLALLRKNSILTMILMKIATQEVLEILLQSFHALTNLAHEKEVEIPFENKIKEDN